MQKVLVTGGSGFIGGYVLRHLRTCGYVVTNFDLAKDEQDDHSFIQGSILDFDAVQRAVDQSDIVFHFAGFSNINLVKASPRSCIELNIMGTTNLLEAIRKKGTGKLVFASSVYVHDKHGHFYTTSKYAAELICGNYRDLYGLPIVILRLGTVYGEQSRHEDVVSIFSQKAVKSEQISIFGSGKQVRHFIHGEDVAAACAKLVAAYDLNGIFELSAKRGSSIQDLAKIVTKYVPTVKIEKLEDKGREDDYMGELGDGLLLQETYSKLRWEPKIDIDEGVKRMIDYFKRGVE